MNKTQPRTMIGKRVIQVPMPAQAVALLRAAARTVPGLYSKGDAAAVRYFMIHNDALHEVAMGEPFNLSTRELIDLFTGYQFTWHAKEHQCPTCNGTGEFDLGYSITAKCKKCHGTGELTETKGTKGSRNGNRK